MKTAEAVKALKDKLGNIINWETDFCEQTCIEVSKENLRKTIEFLKDEAGYEVLMDYTGVDYIDPIKRTKVIYWLHNPTNFERIRVVLYADRDEAIPSIIDLWEGAKWYERELWDLFGLRFEGHPDLKRILMPDDWVGHPLRRDYPLTEEPVQFKHDVKPKVPSEIIPYVGDRSKKS